MNVLASKSFGLAISLLLLPTTSAYAVCDSELNRLITLISAKGTERELTKQRLLREHEQKTQPRYNTCPANNSNACIKYWQSEIDRLLAWGRTPQGSDDSGRAAIAWNKTAAEYNICLEGSKGQSSSSNSASIDQQSSQQNQPTGPKENCEALFTAERRQKLPGPQYAQEYTDCLGRILARSKAQTQPTGHKENCEALFTAERRQRLSGPQYAQEYTDCLGRIVARNKVQTAAPVVAPTTQDAQQQAQQKTHDPAAKAHECIAIDNAGSGNFGAFKNICGYKVNFLTCNYKPRVIQGGFNWSADFDCEQQKFGLHTPDGGRTVAAHNRNTEKVYWFACKAPASPVDLTFVSGQGLSGRCN